MIKNNDAIAHRARPVMLLLLVLGGTSSAVAQVGVTIPSSLDQTASVTSRGGARQGNTAGPSALPEGFSKMLLAPGFRLEMQVFNAPEMNQGLRVDETGHVAVPLIGSIYVANDTLRTAEEKIQSALFDGQILVHPQVTLVITGFPQESVTVAGEVQQPGKYPILSPQPVLSLIATAGGVTTAAGGDIEIDHPKTSGLNDVEHIAFTNGKAPDAARQAIVYPGDTVYVRRAGVIYVLGAVTRPGGYLMVNGGALTLSQAIALASGTTPVAASSKAIVVRQHGDTVQQLEVALRAEDHGDQPPFQLLEGDMVYVPTSKLKSALINSSVVLSSAASAAIYTVAGR